MFEGKIIKREDGVFQAIILKATSGEPNEDTLMEYEASTLGEASIWIDDQLSLLTTGKGIWE